MQTLEVLTDLLPAVCAARAAFPAIVRNCSAIARGGRAYHDADLSAIADATAGVLAQHGLVLVQGVYDGENGQLCIRSMLSHTSGQWLSCALSVPEPTSMREVGSLSTYIRCYQQSALLNIVTEDDDGAASTQGATTAPASHTPAVPAASTHGHTPGPPSLTSEQVDGLFQLAEQGCHEPKELLGRRLKEMMGLPAEARITKELLKACMTSAPYRVAMSYDEQRLKRQVEEDIPGHHEPPSQTREPSASDAVPAGAPGDDAHPGADAGARDTLMREAVGVGWPEAECRHIVTLHKNLKGAGDSDERGPQTDSGRLTPGAGWRGCLAIMARLYQGCTDATHVAARVVRNEASAGIFQRERIVDAARGAAATLGCRAPQGARR
jgi:hypothetical protein